MRSNHPRHVEIRLAVPADAAARREALEALLAGRGDLPFLRWREWATGGRANTQRRQRVKARSAPSQSARWRRMRHAARCSSRASSSSRGARRGNWAERASSAA